jgi:hypothetical protein
VNSIRLGLPEVLAYLGWPLIVVLLAAAILFWRDPRVRAAAVACAVLELCNLGGGPLMVGRFRLSGSFLRYHWLQGLPAMAQVLPDRFCILGAGAAGAMLAFSLDAARSRKPRASPWLAARIFKIRSGKVPTPIQPPNGSSVSGANSA